jgi:hypothetical protein
MINTAKTEIMYNGILFAEIGLDFFLEVES